MIVLICGVPVLVTGMTVGGWLVVKGTNNNWFGALDRLTSHNAGKHIEHPKYLPGYELSDFENMMRAFDAHDRMMEKNAKKYQIVSDGPDD